MVTDIGTDEGILGNDFEMVCKLTVQALLVHHHGMAYQSAGLPGRGRVETKSTEMPAVPRGDPVPWSISLRVDRGRPIKVQSFMGLYSYYWRNIPGSMELATPLYKLATKGTNFEWTAKTHKVERMGNNAVSW